MCFKKQLYSLLFVLCASVAMAQDSQPVYAVVSYIKVDRAKNAEYEALVKTYGNLVWKDRIARGEITACTLYSVGMTTGDASEYNYVTVATGNSIGKLMEPALTPVEILKKLMPGASQQMLDEIGPKYNGLRQIINSRLYRMVESVPQVSGIDRKHFQIRYVKTMPGKGADYVNMLKTVTTPMIQGRIKNGEVNGWSSWQAVYPASTDSEPNFITGVSFSSWEKVLSSNFTSSYLQAFPKGDAAKAEAQFRDIRSVVQEEVWTQIIRVDNASN